MKIFSEQVVTGQPDWDAEVLPQYGAVVVLNAARLDEKVLRFGGDRYPVTLKRVDGAYKERRNLSRYGIAYTHQGSGTKVHFVSASNNVPDCYGLSTLLVMSPITSGSHNHQYLYVMNPTGSGSFIDYDDSTKVLTFAIRQNYWDSPTPLVSTASCDMGTGGVLVHRWAAGASTFDTTFNGVALSHSYSLSGTPAYAKCGAGYFLKGLSENHYHALFPIPLLVIASKRWDDATAYSLTQNPWQIFRPQSARVYSFPSAGAPASFIASWAHRRAQVIGSGVS